MFEFLLSIRGSFLAVWVGRMPRRCAATANLPKNASRIVTFLKTFNFWAFLEKRWIFARKNLETFQNCRDIRHISCRLRFKW